jgi:predicted amidohydrolase
LGLQKAAAASNIAVNVGVHEPTEDGKKVKNTSLWISEEGKITRRYQKIHLFDVDLSDDGGPVLKESKYPI